MSGEVPDCLDPYTIAHVKTRDNYPKAEIECAKHYFPEYAHESIIQSGFYPMQVTQEDTESQLIFATIDETNPRQKIARTIYELIEKGYLATSAADHVIKLIINGKFDDVYGKFYDRV